MTNAVLKVATFSLLVVLLHQGRLLAETRIERGTEQRVLSATQRAALSSQPGLFSSQTPITKPSVGQWFVPHFAVDTTKLGDTSLWAIRSNATRSIPILVEYLDVRSAGLTSEEFLLAPEAVRTRNVRDVAGLPAASDGFARGMIRITSSMPISVDYFDVDFSQNFATANGAFTLSDFCNEWQVRFLRFDAEGGSTLTALINGPLGLAGEPTIVGNVYDESGRFLNSFALHTDQYVVRQPIADLVTGSASFGSVELRVASTQSPGAVVTVSHSALGLFSLSVPGVCNDNRSSVPRTGQTRCYDDQGFQIPCNEFSGPGQDGAVQAGGEYPIPRFIRGNPTTGAVNGTVTDRLTGLTWLSDATCFAAANWLDALAAANGLFDGAANDPSGGDCALNDGSLVGDWRLPNVRELQSLVDYGLSNVVIPNTQGTGRCDLFRAPGACAFSGLEATSYWSSTSVEGGTELAWTVLMSLGSVEVTPKRFTHRIWPVRGGK